MGHTGFLLSVSAHGLETGNNLACNVVAPKEVRDSYPNRKNGAERKAPQAEK
jgi:hypothetical protein